MRGGRKVTLADVARSARVAPTTASYVLNDLSARMRIAPDTQLRVQEAALALGYRPNRSARALRTSSSLMVGMVSDGIAAGSFPSELIAGATTAAAARGQLLVVGGGGGDAVVERRLLEEMVDRQVDGLIYATSSSRLVRAPRQYPPVPMVLLNCADQQATLPSVLADDAAGGRLAAATLVQRGLGADICLLGETEGGADELAGERRRLGMVEELGRAGLRLAEHLACPWQVEAARRTLSGWLASGRRSAAVVCLNDKVALGCYQAVAEHGLRIPADVAVLAFDGSPLSRWLSPQVTSVALPLVEMGRLAVELLADDAPGGLRLVPLSLSWGGPVPGAAA